MSRGILLLIIILIAASSIFGFILVRHFFLEDREDRVVHSYVDVVDGNAKLFINGKPVDILGFYATTEVEEYIDKTAKYDALFCCVSVGWMGVDRVSVEFIENNRQLYLKVKKLNSEGRLRDAIKLLPDFPVPKNAAELIDFEHIDKILDYAASKKVYIILFFKYFLPPFWWIKNFPDQLQANSTGALSYMPAFNSPAFLKYADQVVTAVVKRYRNHPALLGWGLAFGWTNEDNYPGANYYSSWGMYDYSPIAVERFREWLREKYRNNVTALREAWKNYTITFENVVPPKPLDPPASQAELIEFINSPGDARRSWLDWMEFRLAEKTKCMLHFANLIKSLDPNHILVQTPASPLSIVMGNAYYLSIDCYSYVKSPIDVVYVNPGLDEKTAMLIKLAGYAPFLKYFEQRGKAAFIKWEGRPGVDYDKHPEMIELVARMARRTGTGLVIWGGHVPMPGSGEEQPEFTDQQIELFINTFRSTPEGRINKSSIAIVDDPRLCFFTYYSLRPYKRQDACLFWVLIRMAGLDCDILTVDEIKENPDVLKGYKALILDNLYRMDDELVNILVDYANSGGGLFIVGRTGVYDWYGGRKFENLRKLLGINSSINEVKVVEYSWSFTDTDDFLLEQIHERKGDKGGQYSLFYIPVFDYEKEGYTILATLDQNSSVAVVGRKGKIVFWFPRLGLQLLDKDFNQLQIVLQFLRNLFSFFNEDQL